MTTKRTFLTIFVSLLFASAAYSQFVPGHVFVADAADDSCTHGDVWDRIWEIDPRTGQVTLFAERLPADCAYISGLAFTPDGTRLRVADRLNSRILEYDSEGNMTVVLDASDGISAPLGTNCILFGSPGAGDFEGDFFVHNRFPHNIRRFPASGGPGSFFADSNDGIGDGGAIAFASDGDLYYAQLVGGKKVLRITPQGVATLFDDDFIGGVLVSLTADDSGHVYVGWSSGGNIYRYDAGDPSSKEVLASGFPLGNQFAMAMSPDQTELWVATATNQLIAIDLSDGSFKTLANVSDGWAANYGIAVVPGTPPPIPAASWWGLLILVVSVATAGTLLLRREAVSLAIKE